MCMESVRSDAVALAWSQGRDEHGRLLTTDVRASRLADMEGWLRRLVGKYRIEGHRWNKGANSQVVGTADCFRIGSGPGVSCVISADWKKDRKNGKSENPGKAPIAAIRPQVLLFGLDPGAMEIRVTHVDAVAVELHGSLQDGAVILTETSPPEVLSHIYYPYYATHRESVIAMLKGTYRSSSMKIIPVPLSHYPLDDDSQTPKRLSRVATTPDGGLDMKFYLLSPLTIWGGTPFSIEWGEPQVTMGLNPPILFDLQFHREAPHEAEIPRQAPGTDFTCAKPAIGDEQQVPDEAERARAGVRAESDTRKMQAWLARLVGRYTVEGTVDLCGQGNSVDQRAATGKVDCIAAGLPASVHCKVNVSWAPAVRKDGTSLRGGVSNLAPAQFLFSFFTCEQRFYDGTVLGTPPGVPKRGLQFLQLDNRGIAEGASSELVGDAFMSREHCIDIPGNCRKVTMITATPESNDISMRVDIEINHKRVLRQSFLLRRDSTVGND